MTVDSTMTAVQEVPVDAMEEAEVHREEVRWRWSVDNCGSDRGFWRGNRTGRTDRNTAGKLVDRDNTFSDVSSVSVVWSDYSFVLLRIERIFSIKTSQKEKKIDNQVYLNVIIKVNKKERRVFTMSVDVTKMPKLGFGLMRLPEKDGELDLEQLCKMVDAYMTSGMNYFDTAYMYCGGKSESIIKKRL